MLVPLSSLRPGYFIALDYRTRGRMAVQEAVALQIRRNDLEIGCVSLFHALRDGDQSRLIRGRRRLYMTWKVKRGRGFVPLAMGALVGWCLAGCAGETKRVDLDALTEAEVGTGLSSQDFRSVCERMARSIVQLPQIQNATTPPKVVIAEVQNETDDPLLRADNFTHRIRTRLIEHAAGKIVFLDRDDTMTERVKQENREKERGLIAGGAPGVREGADYFLTGRIENMRAVAGTGETGYYRLSFRLTDAVTQVIIWEQDYEVKTFSRRGSIYK